MADNSFNDIINNLEKLKKSLKRNKQSSLPGDISVLFTMIPIPGTNIEIMTNQVSEKLWKNVLAGHKNLRLSGKSPKYVRRTNDIKFFCKQLNDVYGLRGFRLPSKDELIAAYKAGIISESFNLGCLGYEGEWCKEKKSYGVLRYGFYSGFSNDRFISLRNLGKGINRQYLRFRLVREKVV